jgi:hypothetical protein
MLREENVNRKNVTGFLLGLGIGLVVGIVFQPQPDDPPPHLRVEGRGKIPPRNLQYERDEAIAKASAAS